ncbi:MAG: zinc ribbon domain-containing protein [Variovorax sp.]|nr:MAG: zinc ribbon domain-containing protein [Variovorax sp.]
MSLTCAECGTVNPDGGAFCTGCGVSLAFAKPSGVARNPFPEEPSRVTGGARASGWLWVALLALVGALAVAGTGFWALQRTSVPDASVPVTRVEPADTATEAVDTIAPADSVSPREEIVEAEPAPPAVAPPVVVPPVVAPPAAKSAEAPKPKKPRVQARRADDEDDAEPAYDRAANARDARPSARWAAARPVPATDATATCWKRASTRSAASPTTATTRPVEGPERW